MYQAGSLLIAWTYQALRLISRWTVDSDWGIILSRAPDLTDSSSYTNTFCCGPYDYNSSSCFNPTQGSSAPFSIPDAQLVFDRVTGSTNPNETHSTSTAPAATVTVSQGASTIPVAATCSAGITKNADSTIQCPTSHEVAVGTGVGIPLGLALCAALATILLQRRRREKPFSGHDPKATLLLGPQNQIAYNDHMRSQSERYITPELHEDLAAVSELNGTARPEMDTRWRR